MVIDPKNPTQMQENLFDLREAFSQSNLPFLVDVFDWAQIPSSFQEEIKKQYLLIWGTAETIRKIGLI